MSKHHMYDNTPEIRHAEEGGTKVVKPSKHEKSDGQGDAGVKEEGFPVHSKHLHERHLMHANHEHEHSLHENHHGVHGKEEMHKRHLHERKEMYMRHEKEAGATEGSKDVGAPIKDIERGAK